MEPIAIVTMIGSTKQKLGHYKLKPGEVFGPPTLLEFWVTLIADQIDRVVLYGTASVRFSVDDAEMIETDGGLV